MIHLTPPRRLSASAERRLTQPDACDEPPFGHGQHCHYKDGGRKRPPHPPAADL
ncbi:hypothetical protein [Gemmata obscuriglobus]|uniref:hypothetical protein n=1 Tax=Gemmata obscuriglobus TaxID=114 RepID=UPI0012F91BCB|nr:hypothetical protein [Gemmata obscuriglobus]